MHMMDGDTSYHVILGYLWINPHKAVASMYHQCVKTVWRGRPVTMEATRMPFDKVELQLEGENRAFPFNATILEQEEDGNGEVVESKRPPKIRRITKSDGKVIYGF